MCLNFCVGLPFTMWDPGTPFCKVYLRSGTSLFFFFGKIKFTENDPTCFSGDIYEVGTCRRWRCLPCTWVSHLLSQGEYAILLSGEKIGRNKSGPCLFNRFCVMRMRAATLVLL